MKLEGLTAQKWDFIIDHPEKLPQGIHLWYKGVPYPRRVYHDSTRDINFFLRTLNALGTVKKYFFSLTYLKGLVIPISFNLKKYEPFLIHSVALAKWTLEEFIIKDDEFSVPVWEMGKFIEKFLKNLGLVDYLCKDIALLAMMILEFDNAYRYRAQDIIGETTKELLQDPRKEIDRLLAIYVPRETFFTDPRGGALARFLKLKLFRHVLIIPKVKKAFLDALEAVDLEKIKFDINDTYHTSFWRGYEYGGKDFDTRYQFFLDTHKGDFPPFRKREDPNVTAKFMTGE